MSMQRDAIAATVHHVQEQFANDGSGHDWWHIYRVWQNARSIAEAYQHVDPLVINLAALLHDIADWKYHNGDHEAGPRAALAWLEGFGAVRLDQRQHIADIIRKVSYKGAGATVPKMTLEGQIVQDADRLDAIGAIGIARTFAYGGHKGQLMYNPDITPITDESADSYTDPHKVSTTINHFYEKLLLLRDRMHTNAAKEIAARRHAYMEGYLQQFFCEWEGG